MAPGCSVCHNDRRREPVAAGWHRTGWWFPWQNGRTAGRHPALVGQPVFDIGFILYGLAALLWFHVIATEPLSLAYPLLVALAFLVVTAGAVLVFHGPITWHKVLGLTIILVGIFIVGKE